MADAAKGTTPRPVGEQTTAELVQRATEQLSRLVRDEMALARAELVEKGKHAGLGAGLFGAGGVLALFGAGTLVTTIILALALAMPAWLAALIVTVALFVLAAILALIGRKQVQQAVPLVPTAAAESVRADLATASSALRDRGRAV
ncbi:phage holin family protein [Micromonospora polyrhachis]|uniref:Tetrahydromethanopterin S-methyltransferase subunit C n=1 Tax=Micromonospora polyrhachis TaxID=1282883 RepID=A0A7W7SVE6_9ACTN|nr:phage holin family protein [Micromonospora polyrhachis]MBB4961583.1 tetrahydromethanopterin S-methyltransferase subunit C [Micromonospora polyrhachis]